MKKIDRQIEAMTRRLVTCPIEQFHTVQKELFALQRKASQQMREPDSLKAGVLSLPAVVKSESNLPA